MVISTESLKSLDMVHLHLTLLSEPFLIQHLDHLSTLTSVQLEKKHAKFGQATMSLLPLAR